MNYRSDLHAGRAGQHIASADLMMQGHDCFPAAEGMPYDLIADIEGRLLKIQVKTTRRPEVLAQRNVNNVAYRWWVSRCGKGGKKAYSDGDVDLFALVTLDTRQVAYLPAHKMPKTFFVRPDSHRGTYQDEIGVARNAAILDRLLAGDDPATIASDMGVSRAYLQKVKHGLARTHVAGFYMGDLTLDQALQQLAHNDNRKIGGRKPRL